MGTVSFYFESIIFYKERHVLGDNILNLSVTVIFRENGEYNADINNVYPCIWCYCHGA
jgi:hypothetical protein